MIVVYMMQIYARISVPVLNVINGRIDAPVYLSTIEQVEIEYAVSSLIPAKDEW